MGIFVWLIIIIIYVAVKIGKVAANSNGSGKKQVQGRATVPRPQQQRSFAAMPKSQHKAVPNVERNCSADDKHRYENNVSKYNKKKPNAIPNVPVATMRPQPKKSGNRKAARQLYIGDPVPQGMRVVKCGYCAADNLVPFAARNEYKCYFCHYDI